MGYSREEVSLSLLYHAGLLGGAAEAPVTPVDPAAADEQRIRRIAAHTGLLEAGRIAADLRGLARRRLAEQGRDEGARLWRQIRAQTPEAKRKLVESRAELWSWGLAERICDETETLAGHDPRQALDLAQLAARVAGLVPGSAAWRSCLQGYAQAFVANALRTAANLPAAEAAFAAAWNLWRAGGAAAQGPLGEWRLLDLEASLRRDLGTFDAALDLLRSALAAAPPERRGRILLKRGSILERAGRVEESLADLGEATPLLDAAGEDRERVAVRFNWIVNLCHLGRHAEAKARLPELRRLIGGLANRLDTMRFSWLSARVAGGLGRRDEARRALHRIGREFAAQRNAYDAALVSLELAVLELEEGKLAAAKKLGEEMVWLFASQRLHCEVLAALQLFVQAVQAGNASAELARRTVSFLERARHNRALRFEGAW
jgi:tetratricopeptide (TPR) repeat protein